MCTTKSDWTERFKWGAKHKNTIEVKGVYFKKASNEVKLAKQEIKAHVIELNALQFDNFDELVYKSNTIRVIQLNKTKWRLSTCTCINYLKDYKCKHTTSLRIRLGFENYPATALALPIEQRRRSGRPKNSVPALQI